MPAGQPNTLAAMLGLPGVAQGGQQGHQEGAGGAAVRPEQGVRCAPLCVDPIVCFFLKNRMFLCPILPELGSLQ